MNEEQGAPPAQGPNIGRFLTPDWSEEPEPVPYADLSDPQSLNLYSYARNNPIGRVDVDGHCTGGNRDVVTDCGGMGTDGNERARVPHGLCAGGMCHLAGESQKNGSGQPAPTNPDGSPKAPPLVDNKGEPIVPGVDGWKLGEGSKGGSRDVRWGPLKPVPADPSKGEGQPNVSWDPSGHWDYKTGKKGETVRVTPDGQRVDHWNTPLPRTIMDVMKSITPAPVVKWGTAGIIMYVIIDEGSRLYPPRNLVPVP